MNESSHSAATPGSSPVVLGWVSTPNRRGTIDIVWSCVFTVFLCSWTVLCLHLPARCETEWSIFRRRLRWMFWAIAGPEFVLTAASGQWHRAKESVQLFHSLGHVRWTMRHGFFADMGGFHLESPDFPPFPVNNKQLCYLVANGYTIMPDIPAHEIVDKSKADTMAKTITFLQACWLLLQVIGRAAQGLVVTTLELGAVAIVVCTMATYYCWLQKPLDVRIPYMIKASTSMQNILLEAGENVDKPYVHTPLDFVDDCGPSWGWDVMGKFGIAQGPKERPLPRFCNDRFSQVGGFQKILVFSFTMCYASIHLIGWNFRFASNVERYLWRICSSIIVGSTCLFLIFRVIASAQRKGRWQRLWAATVGLCTFARSQSICHDMESSRAADLVECRPEAPTKPNDTKLSKPVTEGEEKEASTSLRAVWMPPRRKVQDSDPYPWEMILCAPYVVAYALARTYLVVEVFIGLRALPTSAFETVNWSKYFPHV